MAHPHDIVDADKRFTIDPATRQIVNNTPDKVRLVQGDDRSERFTFEIPRYVEGHDMTLSTTVQIHYQNGENRRFYVADDLAVLPDDDTRCVFSWLISGNATEEAGDLVFLCKFRCYDENDVLVYEWNTAEFDKPKKIEVVRGMDNTEEVIDRDPDALEAWRQEVIDEATAITEAGMAQAVTDSVAASVEASVEASVAETSDRVDAGVAAANEAITTANNAATSAATAAAAANEAANNAQQSVTSGLLPLGNVPHGHASGERVVVTDAFPSPFLADERKGTQPLVVHGACHQVTTTGKNLLDESQLMDGCVMTTGEINASEATLMYSALIPVSEQPYTLTNPGFGNRGKACISYYDADEVFTGFTLANMATDAGTFTPPSGTAYVRVNAVRENVGQSTLQLEVGSTATDYEPYTGGAPSPSPEYPQPITALGGEMSVEVRGRNALPAAEAGTWTSNGITVTSDGKGTYTVKGTSTATTSIPLQITPTTLVDETMLHFRNDGDVDVSSAAFEFLNNDGEHIAAPAFGSKNRIVNISDLLSGQTIGLLRIYVKPDKTIDFTFTPSLEATADVTDFRPYVKASTPLDLNGETLPALPDGTRDTLTVYADGTVEKAKRLKKVAADGTNGSNGLLGTNVRVFFDGFSKKTGGNLLSDVAIVSRNATVQNTPVDDLCVYQYSAGLVYLAFPASIATTYEEAQAWLAENPVTIIGEAETPETITLGSTTLPETVDHGYNTIELNANLPATIDVTYQASHDIRYEQMMAAIEALG